MNNLEKIALDIRKKLLEMHFKTRSSHIASSLSIVEILVTLYYKILKIDPKNPEDPRRDRFILSKAHASSALYVILSFKGFFSKDILDQFMCNGGLLSGHLDKGAVPGVEITAGSLGHGLSVGIGMALASKRCGYGFNVYILCGDGELNEGSMWEAILFAAHHKLDNLTLIVDRNKWQALGKTEEILKLQSLSSKFRAFGWTSLEVNGHSFKELEEAFKRKRNHPKVIIAHTIKGKGISFMEDRLEWHYKSPREADYQKALIELQKK